MSDERIGIIKNRIIARDIEEYEIYLRENISYESIFLKNRIENVRETNEFDYVLRILDQQDDKTGIGVSKGNSLNKNNIDRNIDLASSIAKYNTGLKYNFPLTDTYQDFKVSDERILRNPLNRQQELSEELISLVNQQKNVEPTFGRFRIHITDRYLNNSNGIDLKAKKTHFFVEFALKAQKNGRLSEYWSVLYFKEQDQLQFEKRVEQWANLARDALKAKAPIPNKRATVIFSPHLVENLLNPILAFHTTGKTNYEKMSLYSLDSKIASENVNIRDNGLLPGGLKSNSWDDEGNPHANTDLVKDGIFKNRLYDYKYALQDGVKSTGNGLRAVNGAIDNTISNLEVLPGDMSLEEIISNIDKGYFIDNCAWMNPSFLTGEFGSLIRNGYYIENGKILYPIQEGNVSGNVHKMLKKCNYISKERDYAVNSLVPYMAFNNVTISY